MIKHALLAGGCFWGVEAAFQELKGVTHTQVGYTGGHLDEPTYADVCSDTSGHAEAVKVEYDPDVTSYQDILEAFFDMHDPTEEGSNCCDFGTQYRSVIFFADPDEEAIANETIARLNKQGRFDAPIHTQVTPASTFWPAEDYHQQYYKRHGLVASL